MPGPKTKGTTGVWNNKPSWATDPKPPATKQKLVFIDAEMIINMDEKYADKVGDGWRIVQMMSVNKGFGSNDVICLLCEEE